MTARRTYVEKPTKALRNILRRYGEKVDDIDKSAWARPDRPRAVITLPSVTMGAVSDADVGLVPHEGAQLRAEDYVRIAAAARLKAELLAEAQAESDRAAATIDALEAGDGDKRFGQEFMTDLFGRAQATKDTALDAIEDGRLSSDDAAILAELRRLEQMPLPRWMRPEGESA